MKAVLTASEVATALRVSASTISREAKKGKIPGAHRVGGQWRFTEEIIDRWLTEEPPPTRAEAPLRRRKRSATGVEHNNAPIRQVIEKQNGNSNAHGTAYPMNQL
jgi:excisionase family DNA binding protein